MNFLGSSATNLPSDPHLELDSEDGTRWHGEVHTRQRPGVADALYFGLYNVEVEHGIRTCL